jgi:hypothetical protein
MAEPTTKPAPAMTGTRQAQPKSMPYQITPTQQEIQVRAYQMWEAAGRPAGDGIKFWLEAERELKAGK